MITRHIAVPTRGGGSYQIPVTASVSSSQVNEHSHKATLSASTLTPSGSWTLSNHSRTFSIVSARTDLELCAVAELLSPAVSHTRSYAEEQETIGIALDDDLDDYLDASIKHRDQRQGKSSITPHLLLEYEEPFSPLHPSYSPDSCTFTPSESESESFPEDNHWDPYASSHSSLTGFQLSRRGRARKQSSACVSTSDSDTPSLSSSTTSVSSSQSRSYSPPSSPATLKTPVDHVSSSHTLTIIEERPTENRRASQSSGSIIFTPMEHPSEQDGSVQSLQTMETRTKNRNIENLRVNVPPLFVPFPIVSHSPSSTIDSSPPATTSRKAQPGPRPGLKSLTRIISPVSKPSKSFESGPERTSTSTSPTASTPSSRASKEDAKEEKARKAQAKRMKKAEQKDKLERLAEELKERKRRKALAQDRASVHSNWSGGRGSRRNWDHIAMYDGLGNAM